jgi:hypothetical protein
MKRGWIAAATLALSACTDDTVSTTSTSSSATGSTSVASTSVASSSASTGTTTPISTVLFSGTLVPNGPGAGISGAQVCVYAHPEMPCATTMSGGAFDVDVPDMADTGIEISKQGFGSILIAFHTDGMDMSGVVLGMPSTSAITAYYAGAGTPYPDTGKGFLAVFFHPANNSQQGQDGATVTLVPQEGAGPLYGNVNGTTADPMLMATSTSGIARFGAMPEGELEADALCPTGLSAAGVFFGWPSDSADKLRVPIVAGFETRIGFGCF